MFTRHCTVVGVIVAGAVVSAYALAQPVVVGELPKLEDAQVEIFMDEVYGRRPVERPANMTFADLYPPETFKGASADGVKHTMDACRRIVVCRYRGPYGEDSFRFTVFVPRSAKRPSPAFLLICNRNPGVNIDPCRVSRTSFWPAEDIVARGYAAIAFWTDEIAVDCGSSEYVFRSGVFRCFENPAGPRADNAWGALAAWSWGASRVMDWIETCPDIDKKHVAVVGHSRGGKAALVAGIFDGRFAMAISNCSGCGGAKLNHCALPQSEHIGDIYGRFPYWFCRNFSKYVGKDQSLPFDQHQWLSLMAPRLLYVSSGALDRWAGTDGEAAAVELARPAWGWRGADDVGYHVHEGGHDLTSYDWMRYMDFADAHGWMN